MSVEFISSDPIYEGRAFKVRRDNVRLPDGREVSFDVVQHVGAITLVPVDEQGRMWFVRQWRPAGRETLLELPAGTLEPDELPEACALREIREETGMAARHLAKIGEAYLAPGYSTEYMYFYLATGLYESPLDQDADEFLERYAVPVAEAYVMAQRGELKDGKSLAALLLARPYLAGPYHLG